MYAPAEPLSTYPKKPSLTSNQSDAYNSPVYLLSIRTEQLRKEWLSANPIPDIYYTTEAGIGFVNGIRFRFKDHQPEFRLFAELYSKINKSVNRELVLSLLNPTTKLEKSNETYEINEVVKKIRKRTGLNVSQLINNNGNLTLLGTKLREPQQLS